MDSVRRLTQTFSPEHYSLSLDIDRPGRTFSGIVSINGRSSSNTISLHAKELTIDSVVVDGQTADFTSSTNDELDISSASLAAGPHMVVVEFHGRITDQMHGMYPCFFEHEGQRKELIATQFESHHAREVFPCVDEPEAKATFDVTLTTETGVTVLGNMPVTRQSETEDRLVTTFERTPRMSSYLLAWVYGELHSVSGTTQSGVEVNIWATPTQPASSLQFALDIATRTIDFFDEYFGVPYPLPKSDHVALPDFSSGAMENWGLITYREVALLAQPGEVSVSSKHHIATVIAHELSHQWFGNLVTMRWWNNLWLNESFANLMEYVALDALEPSWNIWFDFASYESVMALRRDAIDGVQPVQVDVSHPDEISTLFDPAIVYAKGARLLRMLERHIGSDAFRAGLRDYFKTHAYQNTEETDLWSALSAASGEDIEAFMTPWISQPGYPVVTVYSDKIQQERFFVGPHTARDDLWPIPLGSEDSRLPRLFETASQVIAIPSDIHLNPDDSAHFITRYYPEALSAITERIANGSLSPIGRLQLLNEQALLARGGLLGSAELVPLLRRYEEESAESVWELIAATLGELKKFVENDEPSENALKRLSHELARSQYERLGWDATEGEHESDTKLRATIIGLMLYAEDKTVLAEASRRYEAGIDTLDPELRGLVFSAVVRHSTDDAAFEQLTERYRTTASAELQQDICAGLTSTRQPRQITRLHAMMKDPAIIRSQDVARWFVYLVRSRYGRELTWRWLRDNWQWIERTFGGDKSFDDYPRYAASGLMTRQQLEEYREFFAPLRSVVALRRVIDMGLLEIEGRAELIEREHAAVRSALLQHEK